MSKLRPISRIAAALFLANAMTAHAAQDMTATLPDPPHVAATDAAMKLPMSAPVAAKDVIGQVNRIGSPQGIAELRKLRINGIDQWISIRGKDRRNPVLLFLHGGPGYTMMPAAWAWQAPFEDFFTVVQWDQRGAGKTFLANDPQAVAPTMKFDTMVDDGIALIEQLRLMTGQRKIFLIGHSWGSSLGLYMAARRPDLLYAYIGAGQAVDGDRSLAATAAEVEALARAANDTTVADALAGINRDPASISRNAGLINRYARYYGGMIYDPAARDADSLSVTYRNLVRASPDYTAEEQEAWLKGVRFSVEHLNGQSDRVDRDAPKVIKVPLLLLVGEHDLITNHRVADQWFAAIRAPVKKKVSLPDAAHMMFTEQPGLILRSLLDFSEPIMRKQTGYRTWPGFSK
ncbi:hypothetical protein ASE00_13000 [Sphingomonas sp. Root710]|nr:hypothetical protein ASE00_13000 [Sphingomonas sp. Root710]